MTEVQNSKRIGKFNFRGLNIFRIPAYPVRLAGAMAKRAGGLRFKFRASRDLGFTLIELMVVVALIALIAAAVLATLSSARIKSRDARRLADIKSIQTALDLYVTNARVFPNPTVAEGVCLNNTDAISALLINTSSIAVMPQDPLQNCSDNFHYHYTSTDGSTYTLSFFVERGDVPGISNLPPACDTYPCQKILNP
jgi:general secretion pathway protein G